MYFLVLKNNITKDQSKKKFTCMLKKKKYFYIKSVLTSTKIVFRILEITIIFTEMIQLACKADC